MLPSVDRPTQFFFNLLFYLYINIQLKMLPSVNLVHVSLLMSGNIDCHEFRFSIVSVSGAGPTKGAKFKGPHAIDSLDPCYMSGCEMSPFVGV